MSTTSESLALIKEAQANPLPDMITKAFTQPGGPTTGLQYYDLETPARRIYPLLTPLRNIVPRLGGGHSVQANWRAITGINVNAINAGVSEGNRGGVIATSVVDYMAAFRGIGLEDYVTFEADFAAQGFDDVKSISVEGLLRSLMIAEEGIILGGNTSVALGTTPTPTVAVGTGTSTLAASTISVIAVALGFDAYWALGGTNNGTSGGALNLTTAVIPAAISRTNADGSSDSYGGGSARKSANATLAVTAGQTAVASVAVVPGAVAYAWFWGAAGSEVLGAVTTLNSVLITANPTGTQTAASLPASDNSTNSLVFDGILSQIAKAGSGAYWKALATGSNGAGSTLTSDGAGGVVEIDAAFSSFWNLYRLSPDTIYCNAQQMTDINRKVIGGGGAPLYRFTVDPSQAASDANAGGGGIVGGIVLGSYLNKIAGKQVKLEVHPTLPPGTLLFWSNATPYKLSGVGNIVQIRTRRDYYQIEWPVLKRRYEYGVYSDQVLQNYFPPAFGVLTNIAAG